MKMHELMKEAMNTHKAKIEIFQWAVMAGVSSLIYSEYIKNIKQKQVPTRLILVPKIQYVCELLKTDSHFRNLLSESLIDKMIEDDLMKKYIDIPELVLFKDENIEILKTILDLYILPNVEKNIPNTISRKFGLNNPDNQLIKESNEIDLFKRIPITDKQFEYIVHEIVLQFLILLPSIKKHDEFPEDNTCIYLCEDEIITINHENALCPIHIDKEIISNKEVMNLLSFVTNTRIDEQDYQVSYMFKNNKMVFWEIISNTFNRIMITELL